MNAFFNLQQTFEFRKVGEQLIPNFKEENRKNLTDEELANLLVVKKYATSVKQYLLNPPKSYKHIVGVDIETTGLNFMEDRIRLIAVYGEDFKYVGENLEEVKQLLMNPDVLKVFHHSQFDVCFLKTAGIEVCTYTDTFIMNQILNNLPVFDSLDHLASVYLGKKLEKSLQHSDNWQGNLTQEHYAYCLEDAKTTYELHQSMFNLIIERYLYPRYRREIEALPALIELNMNGKFINWKKWSEYLLIINEEREKLGSYLREQLGCNNLNSSHQLKQSLQAMGISVASVQDEKLKFFSSKYPIVNDLVRYKKYNKLLTTYGEKLKDQVSKDGRLRGHWNLIGTKTFRMSCQKPNFQSIPTEMKPYFESECGNVFIIMDYSTIELRILAELTGSQKLIDAFNRGADLHIETAKAILNKESISDDERSLGKVVNFGLIYGLTPYGLKEKVNVIPLFNINEYQAEEFMMNYFKTYPEVAKYQQQQQSTEIITTLGGSYWDETNGLNQLKPRQRYNYAVQASCAEGLKESLALFHRLKQETWKLVSAIHDEIILEVPENEALMAENCLKKAMIDGMSKLVKKVPIEVSVNRSKTWRK